MKNSEVYASDDGITVDPFGIWQVFGEDPNCDFGGSHIEPTLGFFEGKRSEVLAYAKLLPKWITCGDGGRIKRINVTKVDKNKIIAHRTLQEEQKKLKARLKEINFELGVED